jgi:hypothetical protein
VYTILHSFRFVPACKFLISLNRSHHLSLFPLVFPYLRAFQPALCFSTENPVGAACTYNNMFETYEIILSKNKQTGTILRRTITIIGSTCSFSGYKVFCTLQRKEKTPYGPSTTVYYVSIHTAETMTLDITVTKIISDQNF